MSAIWLVTYNYDWEESIFAFTTRKRAIAHIAETFEIDEEILHDTPKFWEAVAEAFGAGKWKGYQFLKLDTETLDITEAQLERDEPAADTGWAADPVYGFDDWRQDVANGDTRLGYAEWVLHQREAELDAKEALADA